MAIMEPFKKRRLERMAVAIIRTSFKILPAPKAASRRGQRQWDHEDLRRSGGGAQSSMRINIESPYARAAI
jgi:hypothetical protein